MKRLVTLSFILLILCANVAPALADTTYIVQPGDTLFGLAIRFGTTVPAIMQANNLGSSLIFVGQRLIIPTGTTGSGSTSGGSSGSTSGGSAGPCGATHTVQGGVVADNPGKETNMTNA